MSYLDRRAVSILQRSVEALRDLGVEIGDADVDDLYASNRGDHGAIAFGKDFDMRVEIHNGQWYDGEDNAGRSPGWGIGFGCTGKDGRIGPGGILYNYSPDVWTRDRDEIRNRLSWLEDDAVVFAENVCGWLQEV